MNSSLAAVIDKTSSEGKAVRERVGELLREKYESTAHYVRKTKHEKPQKFNSGDCNRKNLIAATVIANQEDKPCLLTSFTDK